MSSWECSPQSSHCGVFPETLARSGCSLPAQEALPGRAVLNTHKKIKDSPQTDTLEPIDTLELTNHPRESPSRPTGADAGTQHPSVMLLQGPFPARAPVLGPGQAGSRWHFLPGLCFCYLAWKRRHLASRHRSLGHQSFRFVHMGFSMRSCGQGKTRSMGRLTPDGPSRQSLSPPA